MLQRDWTGLLFRRLSRPVAPARKSTVRVWRLSPESNRGTRICSPLHDHSATQPWTSFAPQQLKPRPLAGCLPDPERKPCSNSLPQPWRVIPGSSPHGEARADYHKRTRNDTDKKEAPAKAADKKPRCGDRGAIHWRGCHRPGVPTACDATSGVCLRSKQLTRKQMRSRLQQPTRPANRSTVSPATRLCVSLLAPVCVRLPVTCVTTQAGCDM